MDFFAFEEGASARGVRVEVKHLPWADSFVYVCAILEKIGARLDPRGKEGLAHLLEHSHDRGSAQFPDYAAIRALEEDLFFGSLNAWTDLDITWYWGKTVKARLAEAIVALQDIMFRPRIRPETVREEQEVIIREIWREMRNRGNERLLRLAQRDLYGDHPFGRFHDAAGWADAVSGITADDLRAFHEEYYHLGNLRLLFVGNITLDEALVFADLFAAGLPEGEPASMPERITAWPAPARKERNVSSKRWHGTEEVEESTLKVQRVLPKFDHPETLRVLRYLLLSFFDVVRGKLTATYRVDVKFEHYLDHHLLVIESSVTPQKFLQAREAIEGALHSLGNGRDHGERFRKAQVRTLKNGGLLDLSGVELTERAIGTDIQAFGRIIPVAESTRLVAGTTYEEIRELVRTELAPEKLHWLIENP